MKWYQNKQDLKEKFLVMAVTTAIFLPVRLIYYGYISKVWYTSFGVVSVIALILIILVHYNKLGNFGRLYKKQMHSIAKGKLGTAFILFTSGSIIISAFWVIYIDRGDSYYFDERELVLAVLATENKDFHKELLNSNIPYPSTEAFLKAEKMTYKERESYVVNLMKNIDFVFALQMSLENYDSNGWITHFLTVAMVGEFEAVAVTFAYRRIFREKKSLTIFCNACKTDIPKNEFTKHALEKHFEGNSKNGY